MMDDASLRQFLPFPKDKSFVSRGFNEMDHICKSLFCMKENDKMYDPPHSSPQTFLFSPLSSTSDHKKMIREPTFFQKRSSSSFGSWSFREDEFSDRQAVVGKLPPTKPRKTGDHHRMIGCPSPCTLSSENWHSFYKRFQSKSKKKKARTYAIPHSESGMLSKFARRMFTDCSRVMDCRGTAVSEEWIDYREVPLPKPLTPVNGHFFTVEKAEEQCRVDLTE